MKQPQRSSKENLQQSEYWMRSLSFAGLHRILNAVAAFPNGLRAGELNELLQKNNILLTRRSSPPAPTTLYHYRNALLHLHALKRNGRLLRVNDNNPNVCKLLDQPAPANGDPLSDSARDPFAALVLNNEQCRSLFFDLFMPSDASFDSVTSFRQRGVSVRWSREHSSLATEIVFQNDTTGRTARCSSPASVAAVLYGVRYWARDELDLIDEYCQADGSTVMFPVSQLGTSDIGIDSPVMQTVRFLLSLRADVTGEWTLFSVSDLIVACCEARRQPINVLFGAIDWLLHTWPHHTVLIPTSRALATLTAVSPQRENLELRRYYRTANSPYISHLRLHKDITAHPMESIDHDRRNTAKTPA